MLADQRLDRGIGSGGMHHGERHAFPDRCTGQEFPVGEMAARQDRRPATGSAGEHAGRIAQLDKRRVP